MLHGASDPVGTAVFTHDRTLFRAIQLHKPKAKTRDRCSLKGFLFPWPVFHPTVLKSKSVRRSIVNPAVVRMLNSFLRYWSWLVELPVSSLGYGRFSG